MKLMTKTIENQLIKNPIYSKDGQGDAAKVVVKFFGGSSATWLVTEGGKTDDVDWELYGKFTLNGIDWEWGYVMLSDLMSIRFRPFGLGVERDIYFSGTVADGIKS